MFIAAVIQVLKRETQNGVLTGSFYKCRVVFPCQERVLEVTEELLQKPRHTIDVVEEVFRVPEIKAGRIRGYSCG